MLQRPDFYRDFYCAVRDVDRTGELCTGQMLLTSLFSGRLSWVGAVASDRWVSNPTVSGPG